MIYVLAVIVALLIWGVWSYNKLIGLRVRGANAWVDIDVQLKRRHDLVPNLVAVVQGYASHEKTIFEDVARLRSEAINSETPADAERCENGLASAIRSIFAIAENYPALKADANFRKLQDQLAEVENNIQYARRYYNAVVRDMNTAIQTVPTNVIASVLGFRAMQYFQMDQQQRQVIEVDFTGEQK